MDCPQSVYPQAIFDVPEYLSESLISINTNRRTYGNWISTIAEDYFYRFFLVWMTILAPFTLMHTHMR